jgi:hypothetical protein
LGIVASTIYLSGLSPFYLFKSDHETLKQPVNPRGDPGKREATGGNLPPFPIMTGIDIAMLFSDVDEN